MIVSKSQLFTTSGTFNVPADVSLIWVSGVGGGAGGSGGAGGGGGGGAGGASENMFNMPRWVTPGDTLTITVGAGGARGAFNDHGAAGTDSTDGFYTIKAAPVQSLGGGWEPKGGSGGGAGGFVTVAQTTGGLGIKESAVHFGGAGGAGAGNVYRGGGAGGTLGGTGGNEVFGGFPAGGGGGASSPLGTGGHGGDSDNTIVAQAGGGKGAGGGGGRGLTGVGATGSGGYVLIQWAN